MLYYILDLMARDALVKLILILPFHFLNDLYIFNSKKNELSC